MDKLYTDLKINTITIQKTIHQDFRLSLGQKMKVTIGGKPQDITISRIERDEANFHYFGAIAYAVYAIMGGEEFLWRSYHGYAVECIYDYND